MQPSHEPTALITEKKQQRPACRWPRNKIQYAICCVHFMFIMKIFFIIMKLNSVYAYLYKWKAEKLGCSHKASIESPTGSVMKSVFCGTTSIGNGASMKRTWVLAFVFGTLLAVSAVSASAQSLRSVAEAKVPFGFRVGDASLPAGEYSILTNGAGLVLIRNDQDKKGVFALGNTQASVSEAPAQLVFNRYGENYFLSQIDLFGGSTTRIAPSKVEREYQNASKSVAEVTRQPEVVQIALSTGR
jgi:hypothetical protein